jgi:hypothetical protein
MYRYRVELTDDHFRIWDLELDAECTLPPRFPGARNTPLRWGWLGYRGADAQNRARQAAHEWLAHCYRTWGYRPTTDAPFVNPIPYRPITLPKFRPFPLTKTGDPE